MKMEHKRLLDSVNGPPGGVVPLKVLLIGRTDADCVELQAKFVPLQEIAVETLTTLAKLPQALQRGGLPDVVLADVDPESAEDLVMLRDLRAVEGLERTPLVAVTDRASSHAPLKAMRAGADDVILKPIDLQEAKDVFARVMEHPRHHRSGTSTTGKTIVFMHVSGGAGATTLAVNAGCALARANNAKGSGLLDLDIQFGNAATLLDLPATSPVQDFIDDPLRLDEQMLESMMLQHPTGLSVLTAPRTLLPFNAYASEGIRNMLELARRRFSHVVLDLPVALAPWTDAVLRGASVIYLVAPLTVPSAHRLIKFLDLLREETIMDLPLKLVANRYQKNNRKANDITIAQFEKATGKKVDYTVPNDYSLISLSHGQGKPAVRLEPNSEFTTAINDMLSGEMGKNLFGNQKRGFFGFGRG
jgi:pilus assembly protein CpaE